MSAIKRLVSGRREETQLWSKIADMNGICLGVAKGMETTFALVASGDRQSAIAEAQKTSADAKKGLATAREARRLLLQTSLSPTARDDIAVILGALCRLLSSAREGSGTLVQRRLSPSVVFLLNDVKLQYTLIKLFEKVEQTTASLIDAINSLPNDPSKSNDLSLTVGKMVEEVESAKAYLLERLYEQEKSVDVMSLVQLSDIIHCGSSLIADFDDCSESVRALATAKT